MPIPLIASFTFEFLSISSLDMDSSKQTTSSTSAARTSKNSLEWRGGRERISKKAEGEREG